MQLVSDMVEESKVLLAGGEVVVTLTTSDPLYLSQESENGAIIEGSLVQPRTKGITFAIRFDPHSVLWIKYLCICLDDSRLVRHPQEEMIRHGLARSELPVVLHDPNHPYPTTVQD